MPEGEIRKSTNKEPATLKTASSKGTGISMLHHITITPTEPSEVGGPPGHHVEHHFENSGSYKEPEEHVFSSGHGAKLIKHLKKHLGLASTDENEGEEE